MQPIEYLETETQARTRIQSVVAAGGLPDFVRQKLIDAMFNPVSIYWVNDTMETIYAAGNDIPAEAKVLGVQAAHLMATKGFLGKGSRAASIEQVLLRELGNQEGPDPSVVPDPDPEDAFVEPTVDPILPPDPDPE